MSHYSKGFTIVELLITIAIISILTSIATVSYSGVQQRGRDAQRKNDLNQVKIALSTYYNAQVPAAYVISGTQNAGTGPSITITNSSDVLTSALKPAYIKDLPLDPLNTTNNVYKYQSLNSGSDYQLMGTLENKNDKKGWGVGSVWVANGYILQNE